MCQSARRTNPLIDRIWNSKYSRGYMRARERNDTREGDLSRAEFERERKREKRVRYEYEKRHPGYLRGALHLFARPNEQSKTGRLGFGARDLCRVIE